MPARSTKITQAISAIRAFLTNNVRPRKIALEQIAREHGFDKKIEAKELTEAALYQMGRELIELHQSEGTKSVYDSLVGLYDSQPSQSHRTSQSTLLQQYSTPLPLAYLAGKYAGLDKASAKNPAFDPSAGNGLLTVAADPEHTIANEIDPFRRENLRELGFQKVFDQDAALDFDTGPNANFFAAQQFQHLVTNPPFDRLKNPIEAGKATFKVLDHWMAHIALQQMTDDGRAAIIVGGHNRYNDKGAPTVGKERNLLQYLHYYYHVDDIINLSGELYARQGTKFSTRLILISGRKKSPSGKYPRFEAQREAPIESYEQLYNRMCQYIEPQAQTCSTPGPIDLTLKNPNVMTVSQAYTPYQNGPAFMRYALKNGWTINDVRRHVAQAHQFSEQDAQDLIEEWKELIPASFYEGLKQGMVGLGRPYNPGSDGCKILKVETPDSMAYETQVALIAVARKVGDLDSYVQKKLAYSSNAAMCEALAAEQIDGVALAIFNMEQREQGMIIGDQTGIGKGRQAAAIIRYAHLQGKRPIFITKDPNLFSDLYRDLGDIDYDQITPFILNAGVKIEDENEEVLFRTPKEVKSIIKSEELPDTYDFIMTTYSQFSTKGLTDKKDFIQNLAKDNILILDEAHLASGLDSNTGSFIRKILKISQGALYLSATYAKRADSMPLYAVKTAIKDTNATPASLTEAINAGGVALQEVLSSQLVQEGQMLRRQRSLYNVQPIYEILTDKKTEHREINDRVVTLMHKIIQFQQEHVNPIVKGIDDDINDNAPEGAKMTVKNLGASNTPFASRLFNLVTQLLISLKAETIADQAIHYLQRGYKPIIALKGTMESFLADMEAGEVEKIDFSEVLLRALHKSAMSYSTTDEWGQKTKLIMEREQLKIEGQMAYDEIVEEIQNTSTGLTVSPLDVMIQKIRDAGYSLAEITGRGTRLELLGKGLGKKVPYAKRDKFKNFTAFNNNELDALIINQSGSTGASAHAIVTEKVPEYEVKPRVMIIGEPELDVNSEIQKRGRINRTGQILDPKYHYLISDIPAEQRLLMMLQTKLKSLDANTSSNQRNSSNMLESNDFDNKYGDKVVATYLEENPEINKKMLEPLSGEVDSGLANKAAGKSALLDSATQEKFFQEVIERYNSQIEYLKEIGHYDLEVQTIELEAETLNSNIIKTGKKRNSVFGSDTFLTKTESNVLTKPYPREELVKMVNAELDGQSPEEYQNNLRSKLTEFYENRVEEAVTAVRSRFQEKRQNPKQTAEFRRVKKDNPYLDEEGIMAAFRRKIDEAQEDKIQTVVTDMDGRKGDVDRFFKDLYPGKALLHREGNSPDIQAIFLGFKIDTNASNPWAPSKIKAKVAFSNNLRQVGLALSGDTGNNLSAMIQRARRLNQGGPASGSEESKMGTILAEDEDQIVRQYNDFKFSWEMTSFSRERLNIKNRLKGRAPRSQTRYDGATQKWFINGPSAPEFIKEWIEDEMDGQYANPQTEEAASESLEDIPMPKGLQPQDQEVWKNWNETIKSSSSDRQIRYIVTGNLLQGMTWLVDGGKSGLLASYTLKNGGQEKGILLSPDFQPGESMDTDRVSVPINFAWKALLNLTVGSQLNISNADAYLVKHSNSTIRFSVNKTKKHGGFIWQDSGLLAILPSEFETLGDRMVAEFPASQDMAKEVTAYLAQAFDFETAVSQIQYDQIKDQIKGGGGPMLDTSGIEPEWTPEEDATVELPPEPSPEVPAAPDKTKKIKIAQAKAMAQKQRIRLLAMAS